MKRDVLLVNMGGPETLDDIKPYLSAIFADRHILPMPAPIRKLVGAFIVARRAPKVRQRYSDLGGGSPLPELTRRQVAALQGAIEDKGCCRKVEHAFRYTHPTIREGLEALKQKGSERVLVLPLFPHATGAMTGSVLEEAVRQAHRMGLNLQPIHAWGLHPAIIELQKQLLLDALVEAGEGARVLFVAHGIPQRNVDRGDDYPRQVRANADRLARLLPQGIETGVAFQSRLGPVEWTRPYLEDALEKLATSTAPVVLYPLSFVADCLETIYDLDTVAAPFLEKQGVTKVVRVPAFNDDPRFAEALRRIVEETDDVD